MARGFCYLLPALLLILMIYRPVSIGLYCLLDVHQSHKWMSKCASHTQGAAALNKDESESKRSV